jgi:hypothetical protein
VITRTAIHLPKSPAVITVYQIINQISLFAATLVALLAILLLGWLAWTNRDKLVLAVGLGLLVGVSLVLVVIVPPMWLALAYQLLAIGVILLLGGYWLKARAIATTPWGVLAWLLPALALLLGLVYQLLPNLYGIAGWRGPAVWSGGMFRMGEGLVLVSTAVWWGVYGRHLAGRTLLVAAVPALLFALSFQRDPAMTGILTIWSMGLTLFLPWPIYAVALWLAGAVVLANWHTNPPIAYAILLLVAAGYAPQLSSQLFSALLALWLLQHPTPLAQQEAMPRQDKYSAPALSQS